MNIPNFDQTRIRRDNGEVFEEPYSQAVRLSNELRAKIARTIIDVNGERRDYPAKWGFDCETADYLDFTKWLNDTTIKKSPSLFWFVIRVMVRRFTTKHGEIRLNLNEKHRLEFDLILSEMTTEEEFLGNVGFQNKVRLDKSLDDNRSKTIILRDGTIKTTRK